MEQLIARQKARELQIDETQVVREYWEVKEWRKVFTRR